MSVNGRYGELDNKSKQVIPSRINKQQDLSLSTYDIAGAKANSYNEHRYFFSVIIL
jgi:hypothetical protein